MTESFSKPNAKTAFFKAIYKLYKKLKWDEGKSNEEEFAFSGDLLVRRGPLHGVHGTVNSCISNS